MASNRLDVLMHHIRGLVGSPRDGDSDAVLLTAFVRREDEQAFAVLMRRHGPLVWRACLRAAGHEQDAEDVFQATFFMLSRKAGSIRKKDSLSSWLFGVARRLALRQKTAAARRRKHEGRVLPPAPIDDTGELTWREIRTVLDEELAKLPDKYRAPLLLCYYEGLTQEEAAQQLGWNKRSVKDRLERGRKQLCRRLTRRGLDLSVALTGSMLASHASAAPVPATLAAVTFRTAIQYGLGQPVIGAASASALALADSALKALFLTKALTVAAGLFALLTIGGAGVVVGHGAFFQASPKPPPKVAAAVPPMPRVQAPAPRRQKDLVDLFGDPLPPGAVARLGTVRFRPRNIGGFSGFGFLPDNKTIFSASETQVVQFWESATGKLAREIGTGGVTTRGFALSPDGKFFAVAGFIPNEDKVPPRSVIEIWETASAKKARTIQRSDSNMSYYAMAFAPDNKYLVSFGGDAILRIEEIGTGAELLRHEFPRDAGGNVVLSPDGSVLAIASGANSRNLYLWHWRIDKEPKQLDARFFGRSLAFSPDGKTLAQSGQVENLIRLFDVASGRLVHKLESPDPDHNHISSVVFSPDGKTLSASCHRLSDSPDSGAVHIWDAMTWRHLQRLDEGCVPAEGDFVRLAISNNSKLLAAKVGGRIRVWDLTTGKELAANEEAHQGTIDQIAVAGIVVATASRDNSIRLWDPGTGKQRLMLQQRHSAIALSPDGARLAASGPDGIIGVLNTATGETIHTLPGYDPFNRCRAVSITSNGKFLLSWGDDLHLRKWDLGTGKVVLDHVLRPQGAKLIEDNADPKEKRIALSDWELGDGKFSLDGKLFIMPLANRFHVFDVASGKDLYQIPTGNPHIISHAISPDNRLLLASMWGEPNAIRLWELSTRQLRKEIPVPKGWGAAVAFSSDNRFFAAATSTAEADRRIRIWDMANGNEVGVIQGYSGLVLSLAFSPDGSRLISGMDDTTALVWDWRPKH